MSLHRSLLALLLISSTHSSCADEVTLPEREVNGPTCGPCDMTMPSDHPLTAIAEMQFAVCGGRCEELISADPERYSEFAVSE